MKNCLIICRAIVSGVLVVLAFPGVRHVSARMVAFVSLSLVSLEEKRPWEAFQSGFVFGIVYFFGTLYWIYHSIHFLWRGILCCQYCHSPFIMLLSEYVSAVFAYLFSSFIKGQKFAGAFLSDLSSGGSGVYPFITPSPDSHGPASATVSTKFFPSSKSLNITGVYGISFSRAHLQLCYRGRLLIKSRIRQMPLFLSPIPSIGFYYAFYHHSIFLWVWFLAAGTGKGLAIRSKPVLCRAISNRIKNGEPAFQKYVMGTHTPAFPGSC